MLKAIKVRLYPNQIQIEYLEKLFGCYRFVYNQSFDLKKNAYDNDKTNLKLKELGYNFHNNLSNQFPFLKEHNTKVLKQSIIDLLDAYKRFFKGQNGFPKFKKRNQKNSVRFPVDAISKKNNYLSNKLTLTKELKDIPFKCSDKYQIYLDKYHSGIKSATLTKNPSGQYFLSILVNSDEVKIPKNPKNDIIGLDLGIKTFIVSSNNDKYENLKSIRKNSKILVKLHRQLSKKQKGSKNKEKARIKLAKKYQELNNIKENYLHQITNELIDENQIIIIEDLNVKGMLKNRKLSKAIQELSINHFKSLLLYKAKWNDRIVVEVDTFFPSSKLCSKCGSKNDNLALKDRTWICPHCGQNHDRDLNAAINIKNEGIRILKIGNRFPELTLVDYQTIPCLHGDRLKQEDEVIKF